MLAAAACFTGLVCAKGPGQAQAVGRAPRIRPDYTDVTIPPNIAPLNFVIEEPGTRYRVSIRSVQGEQVRVPPTGSPSILIPLRAWKKLLNANRGNPLYLDIETKGTDGQWRRFETITNTIAKEDIDSHLVYRRMKPLYNRWKTMGIYQRNLETYEESRILHNSAFDGGCLNCHAFYKGRPDTMTLHIRSPRYYGFPMILVQDGSVTALNTRTDFNPTPFAYASWHPSGRLAAYSVNTVRQFFHTVGENRDVFDLASDIVVYVVDSNTVTTTRAISDPEQLETYPAWSADGQYLYFCRGPQLPIDRHREVHYDLVRIRFDPENIAWGDVETVVSAEDSGLSVTHPKVSPDGRFLLFCMAEYGNFSIYQRSSDLYLMDLESGQYRRLDINSDRSDSYHSWSSNSRWFVFSSKRGDGLFTKPYFSYIDETGKVHKPVLLPQEDPTFYDGFLNVYNVPELITGPVEISQRALARAICTPGDAIDVKLDPQVEVHEPPEGVDTGEPPWLPASAPGEDSDASPGLSAGQGVQDWLER